MTLIIEMPDGSYSRLKKRKETTLDLNNICKAVLTGTPLPKGHGDLIDKDKLWDAYQDMGQDFYQALDCVSAIIEADKEVENETDN